LVEGGAEIGESCALELAARTGRVDNVARLLDLGANPNEVPPADNWCVSLKDKEQGLGSALHAAASKGHSEIVSLLLKRGADEGLKDSKGRTALDKAKIVYHEHVVALLETTT
jgi:ankyrin repeat protein